MILTGSKIKEEVKKQNIFIEPYSVENINPNSYNYHLGSFVLVKNKNKWNRVDIPENGLILEPHTMYLSSTLEKLGSSKYAMRLIGRSSIGRLGLFLQVSADLGHTESFHSWTLELVACKKIKVYKGMRIGQISFWKNYGQVHNFGSYFNTFNQPKFNDKYDFNR